MRQTGDTCVSVKPGPAGLRAAAAFVLTAMILLAVAPGARAQDAFTSAGNDTGLSVAPRPYINPYRDSQSANVVVLGDSISAGLAGGLARVFAGDPKVNVIARTRPGSGFTRPDYFDWNKFLARVLSEVRVDVAVVMIGTNDRQSLRTSGARFKRNTDRWRQGYSKRVAQFVRQLKRQGAAVYWYELPVSGIPRLNEHFAQVNEILREQVRRHQIKFIKSWDAFASPDGGYSAFGFDVTGRTRRLRTSNRLNFTASGFDKLARLVSSDIKFDLARSDAERNVELVGKVEIKSDEVTAEPALPDQNLAENVAEAPEPQISQLDQINDATPTPAITLVEPNASGDNSEELRAANIARMATVKVLLRGESISAKPGRADDFSWPSTQ